MDVKKTIAELTSQLSEITYDSDEDNILLKDTKTDDVNNSLVDDNDFDEIEPSKLRKTADKVALPESVYGGKTTTRKKTYSLSESSDNEDLKNISNDESEAFSDEGSGNDENDVITEETDSSELEESQVVLSKSVKSIRNEEKNADCNIYSAGTKNVLSDVQKGTAIRNQLRVWESLLECRIKLQKALCACNNLPAGENLINVKVQMESENRLKVNKCKSSLLLLLSKMVDLQEELLKQCPDFKKNKDVNSNELDEEIPSDESDIEGEEEEQKVEEDQHPRKKRKLNDYASLIINNHAKFIPFRNATIQKWNDKTKVSTGKMANSNFSAFDQSTLKQIEQIMADKTRLVNRTRIKRNDNHGSNTKNQEELSQEIALDAEIFDDTDFYHKLLRDYIERKSVDVTNSSHTERQLIELQKLRSKMKKNVDTRSTKGRKLRYVVLPKLVNFMAPNPYNTWSEQAETELYNSLFGKIKLS